MAQSSLKLGSAGIWTRQFEDHPAAKVQEAASELEDLGYGAIWFGEATGREALTHAGLLRQLAGSLSRRELQIFTLAIPWPWLRGRRR